MDLIESNFEMLVCGEPCCYHHPKPPPWTGPTINPKCILFTLNRIMKDPKSQDQIERQLWLLSNLKLGLTKGFWVQDIEMSTQLIEILLCKSDIFPEFNEYLEYLLALMQYPLLLTRTNEILDFEREIEQYFDFFGYLLVTAKRLGNRKTIINNLMQLITPRKETIQYYMTLDIIFKYIERSNLPIILTQYLEICANDVYFDLIDIISIFASYSPVISLTFIKYGALHTTMMRLDPLWHEHLGGPRPEYEELHIDKNYPIDECLTLIQTLLEAYSNTADVTTCSSPAVVKLKEQIVCPTVEALWGLRYALHLYVMARHSRNERNFVAALWLLFIDCFPHGKHVQSGIVHDFALLTKIGDMTLGGKWPARVKFIMDNQEDFEFKRMMLVGVIICKGLLGVDRIYEDEEVVPNLIHFFVIKKMCRWAPQFHDLLKLTAMHVIENLVEDHLNQFVIAGGPQKFHDLMERLLSLKMHYASRYEIYHQALKLTWKILHVNQDENILSDEIIARQRKIQRDMFLCLFNLDFKVKNQKLMTQTLMNLYLMKPNDCGVDVEIIVDLLKRVLNPREKDCACINQLLIAAIALLWKHGAHNDVNFLYFIKLKGMFLLLDLIKITQFSVQIISLGYLVDLLEEGTAIPYVVAWQKDGMGLLNMLMRIFRQECAHLGVATTARGVITDPKFPLMGIKQREAYEENAWDLSPALSDMYLSCRPRIYAIIQLLSHRHCDILEIVDEYYKTYEYNLSTDDKITKLLCDNYLMMKTGEVWNEVDIAVRRFDPVRTHVYMLDTLIAQFQKWGEHVKYLQIKCLKVEQTNEHYAEEEFYNLLRETKLGPAIEGLKEIKFLARAANPDFRQVTTVGDKSDNITIETHDTMHEINNFFQAFRQKLVIQSDIIVDPFAPVPPKPVSEDDEEGISMYDQTISDVSIPIDIDCTEYKKK